MEQTPNPRTLMLAIAVVVLCIAAIAAFIVSSGGIAFYVIAIIAIITGFYMAYTISREGKEQRPMPQSKNQKKRSR